MIPFCLLIGLFLFSFPAVAADFENALNVDLTHPAALQEANRVLAEELKLASRPQTYILVDLVAPAVLLKGRGVELHRFHIASWSAESLEAMASTFRLVARPPVARRKIDPSAAKDQDPISLADMPHRFRLTCTPPLWIDVGPADHSWYQVERRIALWWRQLRQWALAQPSEPELHLALAGDQAQSFAWALLDDMPLVIRRPADK